MDTFKITPYGIRFDAHAVFQRGLYFVYMGVRQSKAAESYISESVRAFCLSYPEDRRHAQHCNQRQMKKYIILTAAVFNGLLFTSCASVFCGSRTKVTFDSNIHEEASLTIDGRKHDNVTFPYTTKIRRGFDETVVKAEARSYQTETIVIYKNFNTVSVINLCNILGWGIDAATGAITKPEQSWYRIDFKPEKPDDSK